MRLLSKLPGAQGQGDPVEVVVGDVQVHLHQGNKCQPEHVHLMKDLKIEPP